ncbi:hypothetical protein IVB41_07265 [Bradyrhizobium sp. 44]|uniref:hypothetical protein n=1 Tax=Bradyrhizobium sp. 44 TaxID=2782675 RepID=UPI001FF99F36|nr:hypothetical protein [Bradyrhizobium sp. 44]MCK1283738.1 hypothetical protein [Bradyrhizobium sp. 44]
MTFFANSGVSWPKLEFETSDAGAKAFSAASDIFEALAKMESSPDMEIALPASMSNAATKLQDAIRIYRNILPQIDNRTLPPLSPAEYDFASIEPYWSRDDLHSPENRLNTPQKLYSELIIRLEAVYSRVADFPNHRVKQALSFSAFELMLEWEKVARLARVISVFNRRHS